MNPERIIIKSGREKSIRQRHPWIFSGSIQEAPPSLPAGYLVDIFSIGGEWLARGGYNSVSKIPIRVWTWAQTEIVDAAFFRKRMAFCWEARRTLESITDAYRIVNAENDGLPGLILDRYGDYAVIQFLTAASEYQRDCILEATESLFRWKAVYERSDADVREKEGLEKRTGVVIGTHPVGALSIRERNWKFLVDPIQGHKTGFYLDQRENRYRLHERIRKDCSSQELLNVFCYTGAFSVAAATAGKVTTVNVDSSGSALAMARANFEENGLDPSQHIFQEADAFEALRGFRNAGRQFSGVILDPPKFVFSRQDLPKATRAYKDINWLACRILKPGGMLMTFSCSGLLEESLFQKIVFDAAQDAGKNLQILGRLGADEDHPVRGSFPEGRYLKGLLCRVEPY